MEKFYTHKVEINKEQNLKRLDQALTTLLVKYSRTQLKNLINDKKVKRNKSIITDPSYKVKEGEIYEINVPTVNETTYKAENIPLIIHYEDNDIIIINKNSNMVTHPAPGNQSGTLVHALLNHAKNNLSDINENDRPGIVHRLDKDTSGLIVIAKNNFSHLKLSEQFKNHTISRKYKAIVWGSTKNQIISGYIERHKVNRKKMNLNKIKGKFSETSIKVIKDYNICSLIECTLKTGRTHQVRVHMSSVNCPIIGDKVYGKSKISKYGKNKETYNNYLILKNFNRQALHAYHIGFIHPRKNKYVEFESNIPQDMYNLIKLVLKY